MINYIPEGYTRESYIFAIIERATGDSTLRAIESEVALYSSQKYDQDFRKEVLRRVADRRAVLKATEVPFPVRKKR